MFLHYLLLLLIPTQTIVAAGTFTCGRNSPTSKLLGGYTTELDGFPWMALLQYKNSTKRCGGALINNRYVLTAAHCVTKRLISVRLEFDSDPPVDILIEKIIQHEGYKGEIGNMYNDIALLRLKNEVIFNDYIQPICLPPQDLPVRIGETLYVVRWGSMENGTKSYVKHKVDVPLRNNSYCEDPYREYGFNMNLTSSQWCAGGVKGKDSCRGDSGGPLMKRHIDENKETIWYTVGVISFGLAHCGMEGWGGVYTKVSSYMPWIESNIK